MRGLRQILLSTALVAASAMPSFAQDREQTLADIRQELTVLHVEVQRLNRELSTTGAPSASLAGTSVLDRVTAIEAELQRLTAQTEQLQYRIQRIVEDGTNRIGDLEFRLVELEGGDLSQLGETTTLGGSVEGEGAPGLGETAVIAPGTAETAEPGTGELAVGEEADYQAAMTDLEAENYQMAADKLATFKEAYPGSPLTAKVDFGRGKALDGLGDTREAARAYLAAFTGDTSGAIAPEALYELGAALGRLGQVDQACITLAEVSVRFPNDPAVTAAEEERSKLACS
ncbi:MULTISPECIES: tetratricopeptide repeat protein [unclassified Epibacterium]|uniref:tetratricopeptide repeat protein n=1 Tax=unclassified Epibacterium TaxID=2639179 RepID=UPI001EF65570|nr:MULTISPECIES: tetratricopeptide repeat protein [unclassified Epibacterium]MCG7625663.1 tetratricopeptide repeat protein [Epibacterium sp. Ofav1-8]MCG7628038.1 tetratricopeptide repeat protein [Epibacterium sp. MM17-32]